MGGSSFVVKPISTITIDSSDDYEGDDDDDNDYEDRSSRAVLAEAARVKGDAATRKAYEESYAGERQTPLAAGILRTAPLLPRPAPKVRIEKPVFGLGGGLLTAKAAKLIAERKETDISIGIDSPSERQLARRRDHPRRPPVSSVATARAIQLVAAAEAAARNRGGGRREAFMSVTAGLPLESASRILTSAGLETRARDEYLTCDRAARAWVLYLDGTGVEDPADFLFLNLEHDTPNYFKVSKVFGCIEFIRLDESVLRLRPQNLVDGLGKWFSHCECPKDFLDDYVLQRALNTVYLPATVAEVQAKRLLGLAYPYPRVCLIWLDGMLGAQPSNEELLVIDWKFAQVVNYAPRAHRWQCYMLVAGLCMSYGDGLRVCHYTVNVVPKEGGRRIDGTPVDHNMVLGDFRFQFSASEGSSFTLDGLEMKARQTVDPTDCPYSQLTSVIAIADTGKDWGPDKKPPNNMARVFTYRAHVAGFNDNMAAKFYTIAIHGDHEVLTDPLFSYKERVVGSSLTGRVGLQRDMATRALGVGAAAFGLPARGAKPKSLRYQFAGKKKRVASAMADATTVWAASSSNYRFYTRMSGGGDESVGDDPGLSVDEIRAMLPAPTNSYRLDLREGVVTALQGFTGSQWKVITEVVGLLNVDAPTITLGDELLLQDELLEGDSESEDHARSVVEEASRAEGARGGCSGVLSGILGVIADSHLSFPAKQLSSTLVLEHDAVGAGGKPMVVDLGMAGILRFLRGVFLRQEVVPD